MTTTKNETPPYETRSDVASQVVEFLNDLRSDDIITELVQNDLDQQATKTTITISQDALVAEGNGEPVDTTGWKRLTYMLGAGVEVPAKKDGIGVKNHGLRACFSLGDIIVVRSASMQTRLTLRKNGSRGGLSPGAWTHPVGDPGAPLQGCRIEVPFRTTALKVPGGERVELPVPSEAEIEAMFLETCAQASKRLLGCFRPGYKVGYELELIHWKLGRYRFTYSVAPLRSRRRLMLYRRRCIAETPSGKQVYQEDAYLYAPSKPLALGRRVSSFYRHHSRQVVEVSWQSNGIGVPLPSSGQFRYPIGYTGDADNARTSIGTNVSAPFVSETVRHGLASAAQTHNERLITIGEQALIRILKEYLVPKYGPAALAVLDDPERQRSVRAQQLVLAAAWGGALPAAPKSAGKRRAGRMVYRCLPSGEPDAWSFVVPAFSWERKKTSAFLAALSPPEYPQIHSGCSEQVIEVLLGFVYERKDVGVPHTSFDELDVVKRLQPASDGFFPWQSPEVWKKELSDAKVVRKYLDVVAHVSGHDRLSDEQVSALMQAGMLPDQSGEPTPWNKLYWARRSIEPIPGVATPHRTHPDLADHELLRKGRLKLKEFVLDDYISNLDFKVTTPKTREMFFMWLTRNYSSLKGRTLKQIADYPIWLTLGGEFVRFVDLCSPDRQFQRALRGYVKEPATSVLAIKKIRRDRRGVLRLRKLPTTAELRFWYNDATESLPRDRVLSSEEREALRRFESDLRAFRSHDEIRSRLSWLDISHPGLSRSDAIRPLADLHLETDHVKCCALHRDDLAAADAETALYRELGARTRPSSRALFRALEHDAGAQEALHYRLAAYVAAVERGEREILAIRQLPFLDIAGERYPPEAVAFRSSRDFWGRWKVNIDADGMAADRQANLRFVGVTARKPNEETSRQFFEWLSAQDESTVRDHLDQVIRHFLSDTGPLRWWQNAPDLPCLPVYGRDRRIRLVSRNSAFTPSNQVLLPDFPVLEDMILRNDRRRRIAIVETSKIQDSILADLKKEGLTTVRQAAGPPVRVEGAAESAVGFSDLGEYLARLNSPRFEKELRKRLQEQQIPGSYLKTQWRLQMRRIIEVCYARNVTAEYTCGSARYPLRVPSGIDPTSGVLWVESSSRDPVSAVFTAVAERIFTAEAPSYFAFALRKAVESDFESRFKSEQMHLDEDVDENSIDAVDSEGGAKASTRSSDVKQAHTAPLDEPDGQPEPESFTLAETRPGGNPTSNNEQTRSTGRRPSSAASRPEDPVETAAVKKLKSRHYAWHCQACLSATDPARLAPEGSYASRPLHRRAFMQAHHVDLVHGEGARAIGNIIVLCSHHHSLFGDKLERKSVRLQLEEHSTLKKVEFPGVDGREPKHIDGVQIVVTLDTEPWKASLFFTTEHARVWRDSEL